MNPRHLLAAAAFCTLAVAGRTQAQVLRELDPIDLRYEIRMNQDPDTVGTAEVSFRPVDTRRGRRLQVKAEIRFRVGKDPGVPYHETVSLSCDSTGVEKFEASRTFGDVDEKYLGVRTATAYAVTATVHGKTTQQQETSEAQVSNLGLFCGGFLEPRLDGGDVIMEYPLLFPAQGRHFPRQKVRVGWVTLPGPDGPLKVIYSRIRKLKAKSDQIWNLDDAEEPLIRMEAAEDFGTVIYSLVERNGKKISGWSEAVAAGFPE